MEFSSLCRLSLSTTIYAARANLNFDAVARPFAAAEIADSLCKAIAIIHAAEREERIAGQSIVKARAMRSIEPEIRSAAGISARSWHHVALFLVQRLRDEFIGAIARRYEQRCRERVIKPELSINWLPHDHSRGRGLRVGDESLPLFAKFELRDNGYSFAANPATRAAIVDAIETTASVPDVPRSVPSDQDIAVIVEGMAIEAAAINDDRPRNDGGYFKPRQFKGVSADTLRKLGSSGKVRRKQCGKQWLYSLSDVSAYNPGVTLRSSKP